MAFLVCDKCGAISDTSEDKEMLYWIEKAGLEIIKCLCLNCKPSYSDYTFDSLEEAMRIIKLRAKYLEGKWR